MVALNVASKKLISAPQLCSSGSIDVPDAELELVVLPPRQVLPLAWAQPVIPGRTS
jgi:hypothetical protein